MASKIRLKTNFKKSKTISPLHTNGPAAITKDGTRLFTCLGEEVLLTDIASGTEICRFKGDTTAVTALAVSPTSSHLAIFYSSMALRIYELPTYPSLSAPSSSQTAPKHVFIHPVRTISKCHEAPVHVCRVDPSSTLLASGSADGVVKVWDIQRGYVTHMFKGHGGIVSALAFNYPRETSTAANAFEDTRFQLITASADTRIRIFDLTATSSRSAGAKAQDILEGHISVPRGLDVTADGRWLVSGGRDSVVMVWDLTGGLGATASSKKSSEKGKTTERKKPSLVKTIPVLERVEALGMIAASEVVASPSSSDATGGVGRLRFFTGGEKGVIRIWDATNAEVVASFGVDITATSGPKSDAEEPREIIDVMYTPATSTISSLHADQNILSYSLTTGLLTKQHIGFNDEIIDSRLMSTPSSSSASGSSSAQVLALATNSSLIRLYDTSTLDARLLSSHTDMVLCLDATISTSPSSSGGLHTLLASGSKDKSARIWAHTPSSSNALDWSCVGIAEGHAESVGALALSRPAHGSGSGSSKSSATLMFTGSQDRTVKMWDLSSLAASSSSSSSPSSSTESNEPTPTKLKSLLTLRAHEKDINSLDVSPGSRYLATGSQDKTANIYEIVFVPGSGSGSEDKGKGAKGELKLVGTCKGHKRGVWCVKFSRTERLVATASGDKSVRLWSLEDFSCLKTFEGHTNTVLRVDFISAGTQLVSTASDGLIKIWNVKDEECVTSLDNHDDKIWALAISEDESTIISGAADSVVTFWTDCTEEVQLEKENKRAEQILKEQDFQNYVAMHDYRAAILLALSLNQPGRLLNLFKVLRDTASSSDAVSLDDATSITGSAAVDEIVRTLPRVELVRLLAHVRDWNTTARTSGVAQGVLHAVLKLRTAEDIMRAFEVKSADEDEDDSDEDESNEGEDANGKAVGPRRYKAAPALTLRELIDGLLPYSERHLARADKLVQDSFVVDYVLGEMDMGMLVDDFDSAMGMEVDVEA